MDLRNCPQCGKLYAFDGHHKLCSVCRDSEEDDFKMVKEYLWDHPHATIEQVHAATEVERELIIKFIRDGRLMSEGIDFDFMVECERCGTPIYEGRFCAKCQQDLINGFSKEEKKEESKAKRINNKMFTANLRDKKGR